LLKTVFTYRILSRNYLVEVADGAYDGKIIETVIYDFYELPLIIEEPFISKENITNYTVTSNNTNFTWKVEKKNESNYFFVNLASQVTEPVMVVYTYFASDIITGSVNQTLTFTVPNYGEEIISKVEVVVGNVHSEITPQHIFIDKSYDLEYSVDEIGSVVYHVDVRKNAVTKKRVPVAKRGNLMKEKKDSGLLKISFEELLKKGAQNKISLRISKPKPGAPVPTPPPMNAPAPSHSTNSSSGHGGYSGSSHGNSNNATHISSSDSKSEKQSKSYNYKEEKNVIVHKQKKEKSSSSGVWDAVIAFLYVACLIFLCYECCKYCCGGSESKAEGEYTYICN